MALWGYALLGALWGSVLYWSTTGIKQSDTKKALARTVTLFVVAAIPGPVVSSIGTELLLARYTWLGTIKTLPPFVAFLSGWIGHKALVVFGEKGIEAGSIFADSLWATVVKVRGKADGEEKNQDGGES